MKTQFLSICLLISTIGICQDIITFKSGEEINVKVTEVGISTIKYFRTGTESPQYIIEKSTVFTIKYSDGAKDVFNEQLKPIETPSGFGTLTGIDLFKLGEKDGKKYYKGKNSGGGGTFITSLLFTPAIGLIPAILCSSIPPRGSNLEIPVSEYMNNEFYLNGYQQSAHKLKRKQVWLGFVSGTGLNLIGLFIISSSVRSHR
jgi:hypothetical protein